MYYVAASETNTFQVTGVNQTISFSNPGTQYATDTVYLSATASSGLSVSFAVISGPAVLNGNLLSFSGVGTVSVVASQEGNMHYVAASVTNTFQVVGVNQIISFPDPGTKLVTEMVDLMATSSSGLPVSFAVASGPGVLSGNHLSFTGAGVVSIAASQAGDYGYYAAASVTNTFQVVSGYRSSQPLMLYTPTNIVVSGGVYADRVRIQWDAVPNAAEYLVYRGTNSNISSAALLGATTDANCDDVAVTPRMLYWYWVKATNSVATSDYGGTNTPGYALMGPFIRANGFSDCVEVGHGSNLVITLELNPGQYAGVNANWWVMAYACGGWYYLNSLMVWTPYAADLSFCRPAYRGPLCELPPTKVLDFTGLFAGYYQFWFVLDRFEDLNLNMDVPIIYDTVIVHIQ